MKPQMWRSFDPYRRRRILTWSGWGIGGDEERTKELTEFLISPAFLEPKRKTVVHGVRYPDSALELLHETGIEYRGYLPNLSAPMVYGSSKLALHVPRRHYTNGLSGIPTIRVFEDALLWDSAGLFAVARRGEPISSW